MHKSFFQIDIMKSFSLTFFILFVSNFLFCQDYENLKTKINNLQEEISTQYENADSIKKIAIIDSTKNILINILRSEIFPFWYGTKWDFNGTSEVPKEGTIACGYFVTTTLRDLGFEINRYKYAQMASESMILKLSSNVKRFSNAEINEIKSYFEKQNNGIFIAGLDSHTGFIVKTKDGLSFVHSILYQEIDGVVSQELIANNIFSVSQYKVIGEIFQEEMILNWLTGAKYD